MLHDTKHEKQGLYITWIQLHWEAGKTKNKKCKIKDLEKIEEMSSKKKEEIFIMEVNLDFFCF